MKKLIFPPVPRAGQAPQANVAPGRRFRCAYVFLRLQHVRQVGHAVQRHPGIGGLRLRAGSSPETIASLPLNVFEATDKGGVKALEHPLQRLLHDEPNPEMTSFIWRETMLSHLLLWGNSYCQILRTGRNGIVGLYPLLPDHMAVDRDTKGKLTYTYTTSEGRMEQLNPEDVLHIPGLGFDGVMGYSPIALEKAAIGLGIAAEEYGSKFFQNGARPSGILTHPNTVKDSRRPSGQLERGLWRLRQCQPRGGFGGGHDVRAPVDAE